MKCSEFLSPNWQKKNVCFWWCKPSPTFYLVIKSHWSLCGVSLYIIIFHLNPFDAGLNPADGDGMSHMAQWRRRQLCWGMQDVHNDNDRWGEVCLLSSVPLSWINLQSSYYCLESTWFVLESDPCWVFNQETLLKQIIHSSHLKIFPVFLLQCSESLSWWRKKERSKGQPASVLLFVSSMLLTVHLVVWVRKGYFKVEKFFFVLTRRDKGKGQGCTRLAGFFLFVYRHTVRLINKSSERLQGRSQGHWNQ